MKNIYLLLALLIPCAGVNAAQNAPAAANTASYVYTAGQDVETPSAFEEPDVFARPTDNPDGNIKVTVINVGQGDSIFLQFPDGTNALIDGGPNSGPVAQFLSEHNVTRIDHLVLTHPHADHFTGLKYVFENLQVDNFYDTRFDSAKGDVDVSGSSYTKTDFTPAVKNTTADDPEERVSAAQIRALAAAEPGCTTYYPKAGEQLNWYRNSHTLVLNSCPTKEIAEQRFSDANDCSIILKIAHGKHSALFAGDAERPTVNRMVIQFGPKLKSDMLKVPHHGSRYPITEDFISYVNPMVGIISVGKNSYGHPAPVTLDTLAKHGVQVKRTDIDGSVEYEF